MNEDYSSIFLRHFYPFWRKINFPRQHVRMLRDAVNALELAMSSRILEFACGSGDTLKLLAEKIGPAGLILCTDVSEEMLKLAKNQARRFPEKNIQFQQLDASQVKFDKEFDAVICMLGLSVVPNYEQAIGGAYHALKPGGKIAVIDAQLYKSFPLYFLNFFVRMLHRIFRAKERELRLKLNEFFKEIIYKEYMGGSYFLYVGRKQQ